MADLPRFDEFFNLFVREAISRNTSLTDLVFRTPGTDANAMAAAAATVAEEVVRQVGIGVRDAMLETAKDAALDRYVHDHYIDPATNDPLMRQDATAARGLLKFSRSTGSLLAGVIPAGTRVATDLGIEVASIAEAPMVIGQTSVEVEALAVVAGPGGNVAAGKLTRARDSLFDAALTVTNEAKFAGGQERESDVDYRGRARLSVQALRRGTLGAIEFGARQVSGVGMAVASTQDLADPVTGDVRTRWARVAIADRSGQANATLAAAVAAGMDEWAAAGEVVEVIAAVSTDVQVSLRFRLRAGANTLEAAARIRAAVAALVNGLRVGETLKRDAIYEVVRQDRDVVQGSVEVLLPTADVEPDDDELLRCSADSILVNPL